MSVFISHAVAQSPAFVVTGHSSAVPACRDPSGREQGSGFCHRVQRVMARTSVSGKPGSFLPRAWAEPSCASSSPGPCVCHLALASGTRRIMASDPWRCSWHSSRLADGNRCPAITSGSGGNPGRQRSASNRTLDDRRRPGWHPTNKPSSGDEASQTMRTRGRDWVVCCGCAGRPKVLAVVLCRRGYARPTPSMRTAPSAPPAVASGLLVR